MANSADRTLARLYSTPTPHIGGELEAYPALVLQLLSAGGLVGDNQSFVGECINAVKAACSDSAAVAHFARTLNTARQKQAQGQ